ncbi:hypothetical protein Clacol_004201 [Clathrus columnatus]|uniref:Uncharacterized protein n=1 Tax=Clathrus columnatus TaxID=1419009 RepID=A0AAV5A5Q6_9AGAM|nr:hypothetical protein Clacol_004201 [Clathrus columnatus]
MSDADWALACTRYNDPNTFIRPEYYRKTFPHDPVHRDPNSLKRFCIEFEANCRKWKALLDVGRNSEISTWKQLHLELPIPERPTSISREGRQTKLKICRRCCKIKDGMGKGKGHPRDKCDDGFPIWKAVPYPLPLNLASSQSGQVIVSPEACLAHFRELAKKLEQTQGDLSAFSQELRNLSTFERLARIDQTKSLQETVVIGKSAYNFSSECFIKKSF